MAGVRKKLLEKTRSDLLQQARNLFAQYGYANTAMEQLTSQIGLTRGALYHHFGNKKGLFLAVVEMIDSEMADRLNNATLNARSPLEALKNRANCYLDMALESDIQRIMLRDAYSVLDTQQLQLATQSCVTAISTLLFEIDNGVSVTHKAHAHFINGGLTSLAIWIANHHDAEQAVFEAKNTANTLINNLISS